MSTRKPVCSTTNMNMSIHSINPIPKFVTCTSTRPLFQTHRLGDFTSSSRNYGSALVSAFSDPIAAASDRDQCPGTDPLPTLPTERGEEPNRPVRIPHNGPGWAGWERKDACLRPFCSRLLRPFWLGPEACMCNNNNMMPNPPNLVMQTVICTSIRPLFQTHRLGDFTSSSRNYGSALVSAFSDPIAAASDRDQCPGTDPHRTPNALQILAEPRAAAVRGETGTARSSAGSRGHEPNRLPCHRD